MTTRDNFSYCSIALSAALIHFCALSQSCAGDEPAKLWSFEPIRVVHAPAVREDAWAKSPVDVFILAKLEACGLQPSPVADRRTLIRRATFDLTGLPPEPDEIEAFLQDESPDAFGKVIDRLLESVQYGERWGRHWLDVVRYADARDLIQLPAESDFREAWRYRDWVVKSFNRDLPYDQFIMQQVAGDLMQPADKSLIDADALIATGMLAIADFVPGDVDKQQMIADYVNDQIDVVGRAILGLTLACARCHDHKFDPISTEDYYSLAGIFFSTRLIPNPVKGNTPLVRVPLLPPAEIAAIEANQVRDKSRITELSREVSNFGEREYRRYLEQRTEIETGRYLLATWELLRPPAGQTRPAVSDIAKRDGLDETTLTRWVAFCDVKQRPAAIATTFNQSDRSAIEQQTRELATKLSKFAIERRTLLDADPVLKTLAESAILKFRADDPRLISNDVHRVTLWPNRGWLSENAISVPDVATPTMTSVDIGAQSQQVIRFSGNELLQTPYAIPAAGTLFVVFRSDPTGAPGQRLIGWEDSATGQHGLGIMTDGTGSLHVIARRNGANGDVVAPSPVSSTAGFQTVCIIWGPNGVSVFRDGQPIGENKGIDSVSSDPSIKALRIGGPGSGSSTRFQGDIAELQLYDTPLDDQMRRRVEAELTKRWFSGPQNTQADSPIAELYNELLAGQSPFRLIPKERDNALSDVARRQLAALREELETLKKKPVPEIPRAVVVQEGGPAETPHEGFHDAHIYLRGNHANLGRTVPRGFPKAISVSDSTFAHEGSVIRDGSGRRELAAWLVSAANPLTARVMVNRIWQHHFGTGLVRTSANFGVMGDAPSHPELLDFLADRFGTSGWSMKAIHRLIMLSNVYQQSSTSNAAGLAADPENRLLWRMNRRKLEAEAFRDALFTAAGRLDSTPGGPGFQDASKPRRSLYLMSVRTGAKTSEFGTLFDAPDCSAIVERRNESVVAPQALFLMNDPLVAELATALGQRVMSDVPGGDDRAHIRHLYEITTGRFPTEEELEIGVQLVADRSQTSAWSSYCRLVVSLNEFMFLD